MKNSGENDAESILTPVSTPMQADKRNILQENKVHGHLLNVTACESDYKSTALPSDALERIFATNEKWLYPLYIDKRAYHL